MRCVSRSVSRAMRGQRIALGFSNLLSTLASHGALRTRAPEKSARKSWRDLWPLAKPDLDWANF